MSTRTPASIVPFFSTKVPDSPIPLFTGWMSLQDGSQVVRGPGTIRMVLAGMSGIRFRLSTDADSTAFSSDAQLVIGRLSAAGDALVMQSTWRGSGRAVHAGSIHGGIRFGCPDGLDGAIAHIFNFQTYAGGQVVDPDGSHRAARVVLSGGGWRVTVDEVPGGADLVEQMRRDVSGSAITHVALVEREDGSQFDAEALSDCLSVLGYALSFARGAWTMAGLVRAFGSGDPARWQDWPDPRLRPWASVISWLHRHAPASLDAVFRGMWPIWRDPAKRPILQIAVALLMDSSAEVNLESRIVVGQAGLERLAWHRLIGEFGWSRTRFKKASGAAKVRALLVASGISPALPPSLATVASGVGASDGPDLVVEARNAIVHPPRAGSHFLPYEFAVSAWRLSLEYQHQLLLAWLGYTGLIVSPVDHNTRSFP